MNEGLEKSRVTGVHIWDYLLLHMGVIAAEEVGDLPLAEELVRKMAPALERGRPLDKCYYYDNAGWHRMLHGDAQGALSLSTTGLELITRIGFLGAEVRGRLAQAHYLKVMGKYRLAKEHLAQALKIGRKMKSPLITFYCWLKAADIAFAEGDEKTAFRFLHDAMALGREKGYAAFNLTHCWPSAEMSFLCMKALEAGTETDFAREMIRKRKLVPETPPLHLENWPWPLKIHAFGEFRLLRDDKSLRYSRKAPKKPLELLRVIVALGGRNLSEQRLMDALWPDAEGDSGRKSLSVTLARLRELLGVKEALQVSEGMISLDERHVWTDVRAFELALEQSKAAGHEGKNDEAARLLEKALGMYKGDFLAAESASWAISPRERLRESFLHAIESLGAHWERKQEWQRAVQVYRKGVQADDLLEKCYIRMMACLLKLGSGAEALSVYRRLKKTLNGYEVSPSAEAVAVYHEITGK